MLKLWDLDDNFENIIWWNEKYDRTRIFYMEPLLLKILQIHFPKNSELFWDVKMVNGVFDKKAKIY